MASRSGMSRRSPTGEPIDAMLSSIPKASKTGGAPMPRVTASANLAIGMPLTRVTPLLSTMVTATPDTPVAVSAAATRPARAVRSVSATVGDAGPVSAIGHDPIR